jgi:hypothetical protein
LDFEPKLYPVNLRVLCGEKVLLTEKKKTAVTTPIKLRADG